MKASFYSEYAFRILIYLQLSSDERVTVREIAESFGISFNHLNKVSQRLVKMELLRSVRGQGGGIELRKEAATKKLGDIMRELEGVGEIAKCEGGDNVTACKLAPACILRGLFAEAASAFYGSLNNYTVADLVAGKEKALSGVLFTEE